LPEFDGERKEESEEQGNGERHFYNGGGMKKTIIFIGRFPGSDYSSFWYD
jgi:hypothetical protein